MIETRLLYYFLAIAREQSITRAASSLHITQPTLSKQMMELENQLGKQLIIRGKKNITLTEEGEFLRIKAQEMIDLLEKTETAIMGNEDLINGDIFIGCGETTAMSMITEIFKEINQQHPDIHFHIYSGDADLIKEKLDKGLLDIALFIGPMQYEKYDYINLSKSDSFGILMSNKSSLAQKKYVTLEDIKNIPIIIPEQLNNSHQRLEWFGAEFNALNIIATYNLIYNAIFMAEQELGYVLCLKNLVNTKGRNIVFKSIKPELKVDLYIATKKYQTFSPAVKIFLEHLKTRLQ